MTCKNCGVDFVPHLRQRYCSRRCRILHHTRTRTDRQRLPETRICPRCECVFKPGHPRMIYCSHRCLRWHGQTSSDLECARCGNTFTPTTSRTRYCSEQCRLVAKWANENANRRAATRGTDLTASEIAELKQNTPKCPLCTRKLVDQPYKPGSRELDHIIPLGIGGTHTRDNVRVVCRTCNIARPNDGSDLAFTVLTTLP